MSLFPSPPSGSSRCNKSRINQHQGRITIFQYPPSGSSRCNRLDIIIAGHVFVLSVPSKRVESLQLTTIHDRSKSEQSFSTLQAGRVAATWSFAIQDGAAIILSVPS